MRLRKGRVDPAHRHAFSTTVPAQKTIYLTEPRRDPEGKEMSIEITPRAAKVSVVRLLLVPSSSLTNFSASLKS